MKNCLILALIALLALAYLAVAQDESRGLNADFTILLNTNPDPLPCPPEPPIDLDRDLTVTWGPEVELTNWHKNSWGPRIAVWYNAVHVVWKTEGILNGERIFGRSSLNGGYTWNNFEFVASRESSWCHPAIAVWGSRQYAIFRNGSGDAGFTKNLNNARIWQQPPILLIEGGWHPAISAWCNYVNIVAQVSTYLGGIVAHCISIDEGNSFSPVDTLALIPGGGGSIQPMRMVAFQNYVYVAYTFFWASTSTQEIFFQRSTDYGQSFEPFVMISTPGMTHSQCPSLACTANGDVYMAWMDYKYSPGPKGDILLRRSPDFGEYWEDEIMVTTDHLAKTNMIAASGSQVHVVWEKYYVGYPYSESDLAYRYSESQGQSWSPVFQLCNAHDHSFAPDLVQMCDTLHLVWCDKRGGYPQIYYRRADITQSRVTSSLAFDGISKEVSAALSIHPNPFNPTTTIRFTLPQACFVKLNVFDVTGRNIGSPLVNGWREAGHHDITFDGSDLPSGIYIYRLRAGVFSASGKMVLLK